ncbi:TPA_asm: cell surface protein [Listeria monocytogenes]|uniref:cell surface protein n=1 Tax=Listeria monocytogenes TaxID=1639 RepID=UPI000A1D3E3A|nr:cell surface protein [Listeria monocytogenes]ARM73318.1 putative cellsurface protein [Listeria monocytogenes]HAB0008855.1 cell surface protein [Listeria monocytogenes]
MKKTAIGLTILTTIFLVISCFFAVNIHTKKTAVAKKEIPIYAIYSDYALDVDNPNEVVGDADFVFVGKVKKELETIYKNKTPMEQEDGTIEYIGEAYTHYEIEVISNLKNSLDTNKVITIEKQGGLREDGSAYDVFEDDQLPEAGGVYIFNAYKQDDGSLQVAGANSTIILDEKNNHIDTEKEVIKTEEYKTYEDAVENQLTRQEG